MGDGRPTLIQFFVEGHPSPAHRPRVTARGTFYNPPFVAWRRTVTIIARQHCEETLDGNVVVAMHFYSKTANRQDIDNLVKAVLDALRGIAYDDDRQVVELTASKSPAVDREGVSVTVWEADDPIIRAEEKREEGRGK